MKSGKKYSQANAVIVYKTLCVHICMCVQMFVFV